MILAGLIMGAVAIAGVATVVALFWDSIISKLQKVITKVKTSLNRAVIGSTVHLKRLGDKFQNRQSHFSKDEQDQWVEQIVRYEQPANEIPDKYKEGRYATMDDEFDITDDLELELKNRSAN